MHHRSATRYTECYDSATIAASLDKLSLTITDTDLSPLLLETFDSQLQYDTPVQQGRNNPSSPQSAHMPTIITKHVDNNNEYTWMDGWMDGWISTLNLSVMAKIWKRFRAPSENTTVSTRPALHHSSPGTRIAPVERVEKQIHKYLIQTRYQRQSIDAM